MGFKSGEHGGHTIELLHFIPIDDKYTRVAFEEWDGAL